MAGITLQSLLAILSLYVLVKNSNGAARIDPLVETDLGFIRGLRSTDGSYSMFMGIPYATVDKENPFGASTPHPGFEEVFEANDDSAICPQRELFFGTPIETTLDCLHLNIYVPNSASSRNRLPVLVWIHGGGLFIGFSGRYLYGPEFLIRHEVILVTVNYRLGPYGFMCLDTPEVPGNQGLKDQYLALKWIKTHIESFGGDSDKITLSGQSAGSISVDLHLHYNRENLYKNVILQSGMAISHWVEKSDRTVPLKIADYLGYSTDDVEQALSFLTTVNTSLVIAASSDLDITYEACVEKTFDGVESFITEHPFNIDVPRVKNIPILIGQTDDELITVLVQTPPNYTNFIHEELSAFFNFEESQLAEMETIVKHFYLGDEDVSEQSIQLVSKFGSDLGFIHPTQRSIAKYLKNGASTVYQYVFSYTGNRNYAKERLNLTIGGAGHGDELGYLFDISYMTENPSSEDQLVIDQITTLWTNFAKYSNPIPETSSLLPVSWPPVTEDTMFYLNIDSELSLERRPFHDRMAFWDLFFKMNEQFQKGYDNEQTRNSKPKPLFEVFEHNWGMESRAMKQLHRSGF